MDIARHISLVAFILMTNFITCRAVYAEVLLPPRNIPFLSDVKIRKYSKGNILKNFKHTGGWSVVDDGANKYIFGKSLESYEILISTDLLSSKAKSFRFDFTVGDGRKDNISFAFFYGSMGVAIKKNAIYKASFNDQGKVIDIDKNNKKLFLDRNKDESNTFSINTGYDIFNNLSCVMYINGNGILVDNPSADSHFGVYLGAGASIKINNIRWGRGGK